MILIFIFLALVAGGVGYFFTAGLYSSGDRAPSEPSPQTQTARLAPDLSVVATEEVEEAVHPSPSKGDLIEESAISGAPPRMDSQADESAPVSEIKEFSSPQDFKPPKTSVVTVEAGDTIGTIIFKEFGRMDQPLLEAVRELNPGIEDFDQIDVGQVIRLPESERGADKTLPTEVEEEYALQASRGGTEETPIVPKKEGEFESVTEQTIEAKRRETPTTPDESFRTEKEILVELGEIEGAKGEMGERITIKEPSVGDLGESGQEKAPQPVVAQASDEAFTEEEPSGKAPVSGPEVLSKKATGLDQEGKTKDSPPSQKSKSTVTPEAVDIGRETPVSITGSKESEKVEKESQAQTEQASLKKEAERPKLTLLATEEEVKEFFADYSDRYTRMDSKGFVSLFSSQAVQNGKDRFDEIEKTYATFFKQSRKLQYQLADMKIKIYQNSIVVRARYELDQIPKRGRKKKVWKGTIQWTLVRENDELMILSLDYQPQGSR
jgi:phage tail protein X